MADTEKMRLIVDGVDLTEEYGNAEISVPRAVREIPLEEGSRYHVLGPASFTILIVNPSDRLYALVDGGNAVHEVKLVADWVNNSITHPTHFHKGWVGADGVRKMFGSLAVDRDAETKWVQELPAGASTAETERN
ncbi:hypothetical protein [Streptomyces murinus]|uniref:hypothetical protein n=1 Tax=Streptomyces murinus TaxID=33900 RepID=UPI0018F7BF8D|nr:hypothetical protein [Streptomyces murinus]